MSQPVKLSDELVLDARLLAETTERSIAGQIEFWAALGRAIEPLLRMPEILALRKAGGHKPLSACLEDVDSPAGRRRAAEHLRTRPFPHYEQKDGHLIRIDKDGSRTSGRFVNRQFEPLRKQAKK
jgi:ParD-like antitoxin of type II ParDE toxin-antitoxin system